MNKKPHILFRSGDVDDEEELEIAKKYFPCSRYRSHAPADSLIIARYSALPFYDELVEDLKTKNSVLINDIRQHHWIASFDWYHDLQDVTPKSWFDHDFHQCTDPGPFVVKGRTNSRKQQWNKLMYAPTKQDASIIASELMADPLISEQGIVYRKYIPLRLHEKCPISGLPYSHEFRCFFYKTELLCFGYYWSSASEPHKPSISAKGIEFAKQVAKRAAEHANFFVLDIAEMADKPDEWILIEINDGQQAGPSECDLNMLYSGLADALAGKPVHGPLKPASIRPAGHQLSCPGRPGGPWGGHCNCGFASWLSGRA
jgi:hypothetical protein